MLNSKHKKTSGDQKKMPKLDKLNERQRKFVENYTSTGKLVESFINAGYEPRPENACKMMKNPKIQEAIEEIRQSITDEMIMTRIERQKYLTFMAYDERVNSDVRVKCVELLGKMQGDYIIKHEIDAQQNIEIGFDITKLSQAALNELVKLTNDQ